MPNDHDLLVQLVSDVKHLCKKYDANHAEVREDIKEIHDRIDNQAEGCKQTHINCSHFFVPRYVFYWAAVIVFVTVTSVAGVAIKNSVEIHKHQGYSDQAVKRFDENIERLNKYILPPDHPYGKPK